MKPTYSKEFIDKITALSKKFTKYAYNVYPHLWKVRDDVESFVFLQYLEGRGLGVPFYWLLVDYFRATVGRQQSAKAKKNKVKRPEMLFLGPTLARTLTHPGPSPEAIAINSIDGIKLFNKVKQFLTDQESLVIYFLYVTEYTQTEISALLGCSESRVCQIHRGALNVLRTKLLYLTKE